MTDPAGPPLFHHALRTAIDARGLGLDRISAHLRLMGHSISAATLSYWQSGRSAPSRFTSLAAIGALEVILGAPRGSLARLATVAPPPTGPTRSGAGVPKLADVVDRGRVVDAILADWNDTLDRDATVVSKQTIGWADALGNTPVIRPREIIVLFAQPIETYVVAGGHPFAGVLVEVDALVGGTVRRAVSETDSSFTIAQLALPPIPPGGSHVLEYEIRFSRVPDFRRERGQCLVVAVGSVREAFVEVRFPPGARPDVAMAVERRDAVEVSSPVAGGPGSARVLRRDFGPGTLGIEWIPPNPPPTEETD